MTVAASAPLWVQNATESRWENIPTVTQAGQSANLSDESPILDGLSVQGLSGFQGIINNWNGGCGIRAGGNEYWLICNGGHRGWAGNGSYRLVLNTETPGWSRILDPSPATITVDINAPSTAYYSSQEPTSRHTYYDACYIGNLTGNSNGDKLFFYRIQAATGNPSGSFADATVYDFSTDTYLAQGTWPNYPAVGSTIEGSCCYDADNELVWMIANGAHRYLRSFDPKTLTYSGALEPQFSVFTAADSPMLAIPGNDLLLFYWKPKGNFRIYDISTPSAPVVAEVSISGLPGGQAPSLVWEPIGQKVVVLYGGTNVLYTASVPANPQVDTWTFSAVTNASGSVDIAANEAIDYNGNYNRLQHSVSLNCFVLSNTINNGGYIWKIPAGGL